MKPKTKEPTARFQDESICPYFEDGRMSTVEYVIPGDNETGNFHEFLAMGYRRLGRSFYRNICEKCSSCLPIRLETEKFRPGRSHKRTLKKNEDIQIDILFNPSITPEKINLYEKYVRTKHPDTKSRDAGYSLNILLTIHHGYIGIIEMDYYLRGKLVGVGIVDEGGDALSSNYFYYDTACLDRRPGVFSILQEISLAAALGKKYYYLGFYIEENPKMSYKKYFRPNEIYETGKWREFLNP